MNSTTPLPRSIRKGLALTVIGLGLMAPIACSTGGDQAARDADRVAAGSAERDSGSADDQDPEAEPGSPEASDDDTTPADSDDGGQAAGGGADGQASPVPAPVGSSTGGSAGSGGGGVTGGQNGGGSGGGSPAPTAPAAPAPVITSFVTPDDIDCHNGDFQQFTASFTTTGAVRTTISIDGPGVYAEYGPSADVDLPFNCSSPHSFTLTAYGSDGRTVSKTVTLNPRNVGAQGSEQSTDPAAQQ